MTTLAGAAVALQPLVWSSDPALFAEAVVEGSFTQAELRDLGAVIDAEAERTRNHNLGTLAFALKGLRDERRWLGRSREDVAAGIRYQRKRAVRILAERELEGFQRAFARFAPRQEALQRAAQNFNPTLTFDPVDFLEAWNRCSDDLMDVWNSIDTSAVRGALWEALKLLTEAELDQLRASAEELEKTTRTSYRGLIAYYRYMAEEIDRFKTWRVGRAA